MSDVSVTAPPVRIEPVNTPAVAWSRARVIANSRLPQAATIVPIIGYALIWSDQLQDFAYFKNLQPSLFLTPLARLQLLYWGAIFMSLGWLLYTLQCPKVVRRSNDPEDYVNEQISVRNLALLERTRIHAKKFLEEHNFHPMNSEPIIFESIQPDQLHRSVNYLANAGAQSYDPALINHVATLLQLDYHLENVSHPKMCFATLLLLLGGAVIFLTPSGEVFFMVLRNLILKYTWQ